MEGGGGGGPRLNKKALDEKFKEIDTILNKKVLK